MPRAGFDKWGEALGIYDDPAADASQSETEIPVQEASYRKDEVIDAARQNLNLLGMLAMPLVFLFNFPPLLLAAWQLITQATHKVRDFTQIVLGIPRGHGKTTLLKLFILYCILFTKKHFILVIAATEPKAQNIIADVIDMLQESNILKLFGDWRLGLEKDTQGLKKFTFRGRNIIIAGIGAQTSLRGLNLKNERPDVMIFDDIQDEDNAGSKIQAEALERWMVGTAMKAKSPFGCLFIFVGNMYPSPFAIIKKLQKSPQWVKFLTGAVLQDGTALWEELHPIEQLKQEFANDLSMGHPEIFFAEVLNNPDAGINSKLDLSAVPECKYTDADIPQGRFIIIDPATGKGSAGDHTVRTLFDVYDAVPVARKISEQRESPGDCIRATLVWCIDHNCRLIGVESTAYQSTLVYWFNFFLQQLQLTDFHIELVELTNTQYSKNSRITTMLSCLERGEILLHSDVRSVVLSQAVQWNPMRRDNQDGILDTLTYAPVMVSNYAHLMDMNSWMESLGAHRASVRPVHETSRY